MCYEWLRSILIQRFKNVFLACCLQVRFTALCSIVADECLLESFLSRYILFQAPEGNNTAIGKHFLKSALFFSGYSCFSGVENYSRCCALSEDGGSLLPAPVGCRFDDFSTGPFCCSQTWFHRQVRPRTMDNATARSVHRAPTLRAALRSQGCAPLRHLERAGLVEWASGLATVPPSRWAACVAGSFAARLGRGPLNETLAALRLLGQSLGSGCPSRRANIALRRNVMLWRRRSAGLVSGDAASEDAYSMVLRELERCRLRPVDQKSGASRLRQGGGMMIASSKRKLEISTVKPLRHYEIVVQGQRSDMGLETLVHRPTRLVGGPVLHVHMPKTAGTSLCSWAERQGLLVARHKGSFCWKRGDGPYWMGQAGLPASCRQRLSEARGKNFSWNSVERWVDLPLCEGMKYVVALRRPVERTLHQFKHLFGSFRSLLPGFDVTADAEITSDFFGKLWRYEEFRGVLLEVFGRGAGQDPDDWLDDWLGMSTNYQVRTLAGAGGGELSGKRGPPRRVLQLDEIAEGRITCFF